MKYTEVGQSISTLTKAECSLQSREDFCHDQREPKKTGWMFGETKTKLLREANLREAHRHFVGQLCAICLRVAFLMGETHKGSPPA